VKRRDFNLLKKELHRLAFPVRPRRRHCGYRFGEKVFLRDYSKSSFQLYAARPKPIIALIPMRRPRGCRTPHRAFGYLVECLWDWFFDKLYG